jgi:hypothetical protein
MPERREIARGLSLMAPRERMAVLVGWAQRTPDGQGIEEYGEYCDVVGVAVYHLDGHLRQVPLFVLDGRLVNWDEAEQVLLPASFAMKLVWCDWPKHCDQEKLGEELRQLEDTAVSIERGRMQTESG